MKDRILARSRYHGVQFAVTNLASRLLHMTLLSPVLHMTCFAFPWSLSGHNKVSGYVFPLSSETHLSCHHLSEVDTNSSGHNESPLPLGSSRYFQGSLHDRDSQRMYHSHLHSCLMGLCASQRRPVTTSLEARASMGYCSECLLGEK